MTNDFGDELRRQRRNAGYSQQYLADVAGLSLRHVQGLEAGESQPTLEVVFRLADRLSITPDALISPAWKAFKKKN